jgi:hypothetical protein
MPATTAAGIYTVQADVRTNTARDAFVKLPYTVTQAFATGVTVSASLASPQVVGTPVAFTATGQGSSNYQYRFWLWVGTTATVVRDWGTDPTWTLPATLPAGLYTVQADVRTSPTLFADPAARRDAFVKLGYALILPPATGVTLAADLPSPQLQGTAVTFTAAGQGSTGYQYRFWLWSGTVATLVQNWSTNETWTMPATTAAGSYTVQVDVRVNATREALTKMPYTVSPPPAG